MSVKNFAKQLQATIAQMKAQGTAAIYCDTLIGYLQSVIDSPEVEPTPAAIEQYKAEMQSRNEHNKQVHEGNIEMFRSVIGAGQNAIKTSMLLNGGAAVTMLAFIGHVADVKPEKVAILAPTILPFALGAFFIGLTSGGTYLAQFLFHDERSVFFIGLTSGGTYLAQFLFHDERSVKYGWAMTYLCIALGALSFVAFLWGLLKVYGVLSTGL